MHNNNSGSRRLSLLHVFLSASEGSLPYNEFCLPQSTPHAVSMCTYFPPSVEVPEQLNASAGDGSLFGFWKRLNAVLEAGEYDLIHAHSPHTGLLVLISRWLSGVRTPLVFTVLNSYASYRMRNKWLLLPVFIFFSRLVFCSRASLDSFPPVYRRLLGSRGQVIPNGVNLARADRAPGPQGQVEKEPFTVISVARLAEIKKPLNLLEAFRQFGDQDSRLVFVGDGPMRSAVERQAAALGLSGQVECTGLLGREQVFGLLKSADLFVSASWGEGLPVAVLEAMACRCPVVLSDIPPHREIAAGSAVVPLVDRLDIPGFASEMHRFRSLDSEERKAVGRHCRQLVESGFALKDTLAMYDRVYETLLKADE